jgi:hypothetical protein
MLCRKVNSPTAKLAFLLPIFEGLDEFRGQSLSSESERVALVGSPTFSTRQPHCRSDGRDKAKVNIV